MSNHPNLTLILAQAAISVCALLVAEHYFPWRVLFGKELPRVAAYVLGVLAVLLPWALAVYVGPQIPPVQSLFLLFVLGGLVVGLSYAFDDWSDHRRRRAEAEQRESNLRRELTDDAGQD